MKYMKLRDPVALQEEFAAVKQWNTEKEIAAGCRLGENTVNQAFNGDRIWVRTATRLAAPLGKTAVQIAAYTEEV